MPHASSGDRQVVDLTPRRSRMLGPLKIVRTYSAATGSARAVLNILASYADVDTLETYVGRARLERETGYSRSTTRRAIRRLEEIGEIVTLRVGAGDTPSLYRITVSPPVGNPVDDETVPARERVQNDPGEGSIRPRGRVQNDPQSEGIPEDTERGATPPRCSRHRGVEDPPACVGCRDARLAVEAAVVEAIDARRRSRTCPHGRIDGAKIVGVGSAASRVCGDCEAEAPAH